MLKRKLASSVVALVLTAFSAQAADLSGSIKDDVMAPPPIVNWTGFHVGANVGGLFGGEADVETTSFFNNAPFEFSGMSAFAGGVQVGYDVQYGRWVIGAEADFQWSNLEENAVGDPLTAGDTVDGKLNWFGTVRGRIGHTYGNWMPYITAGLVYGQFEARYNLPGVFGLDPSWESKINVGWTVGAGVEIALQGGWSLRGEYLYLSFPERDISLPNTLNGSYEFDFDAHYARAALSYKF